MVVVKYLSTPGRLGKFGESANAGVSDDMDPGYSRSHQRQVDNQYA